MNATLHERLEHTARHYPDHTAIEDPEHEAAISYRDLDRHAEQVKEALLRGGVSSGERVGLYAPKSIGGVATIFGILKAGAAYVPVDPGAPPARNAYIFQDCAVRAIVVADSLTEGLRGAYDGQLLPEQEPLHGLDAFGVPLLLVTPDGEGASESQPVEDLAYILYTSGSTGKPKGVMHTHRSALSFVDWCADTFAPTTDDRFSSHAPFHFDLSILDLYVPIRQGSALVLIGEQLGKQPQRLAQVIAERQITMWYSTPSILRLLVEYGRMDQFDYSALRIVNFAGEVFPVKHLRALMAAWPQPRYFNLYGPTETNVCTYYEIPLEIPEARTDPFPIGKTCANDRSIVVDDQHREVPAGEEGELLITGGTVMQGYWNRPERTAQAFNTDAEGTKWYKTGDMVKEDLHGDYLFLGRRDRMVKRRGYRVELGEIEAAFYRHPAVQEAAVIALPDEEHGVLIKAFLNWIEDKPPSLIRLKQFAAQNLPLYMVPDRFSFHPALPKTSTDKMDYQKLKELD